MESAILQIWGGKLLVSVDDKLEETLGGLVFKIELDGEVREVIDAFWAYENVRLDYIAMLSALDKAQIEKKALEGLIESLKRSNQLYFAAHRKKIAKLQEEIESLKQEKINES